ncbi:MAG: hypothetical protein HFI08_02155 [Bacilli bacterium]|mgnify:CR=1 FL=1|jgi:hypothetical protein|nr:hypothetical protein [Bacilli bacterium]
MALFKHKNGRVCEVLTEENIVMLRKNSDYKEIVDKKESKEAKKNKENTIVQENNKQEQK